MRIAIVTTYHEGVKIEETFYKKNGGIFTSTYINGEKTTEHKIYKVNTEKPFVKWIGEKFYITGESLEAMRTVI